jgi:DNA (cytosine-5)-methyltransferase 1
MENAPSEVKGRLTKKDTTKFLRLGRKKQSNTLRCGEIFFHPTQDRYLTPREYMRLHGFPDDYILQGPIRGRSGSVKNLDQHRQIANSVPPPVARALAAALAERLQETAA